MKKIAGAKVKKEC